MSFKVGPAQLETLVNFMERHLDFARGKFNGPSGRETYKKLWGELSNNLNSLGFGEKSVEKWQKTWTDYKYALKKKASQIRNDHCGTGGGPANTKPFNETELTVLGIFGDSFYKGVGSQECGLKMVEAENIFDETTMENLHSPRSNASNNKENKRARQEDYEIEEEVIMQEPAQSFPKLKPIEDHSYSQKKNLETGNFKSIRKPLIV